MDGVSGPSGLRPRCKARPMTKINEYVYDALQHLCRTKLSSCGSFAPQSAEHCAAPHVVLVACRGLALWFDSLISSVASCELQFAVRGSPSPETRERRPRPCPCSKRSQCRSRFTSTRYSYIYINLAGCGTPPGRKDAPAHAGGAAPVPARWPSDARHTITTSCTPSPTTHHGRRHAIRS